MLEKLAEWHRTGNFFKCYFPVLEPSTFHFSHLVLKYSAFLWFLTLELRFDSKSEKMRLSGCFFFLQKKFLVDHPSEPKHQNPLKMVPRHFLQRRSIRGDTESSNIERARVRMPVPGQFIFHWHFHWRVIQINLHRKLASNKWCNLWQT